MTDDLRGVHVLVVEDSDDTREVLEEALRLCGASVTAAASAKHAIRLLRELKPHIIVSDIAMPGDGIALVRDVMEMANAEGIGVPVIAVSAGSWEPAVLQRAGFVEFIPKPLDPIALCGRIRVHVRPAG